MPKQHTRKQVVSSERAIEERLVNHITREWAYIREGHAVIITSQQQSRRWLCATFFTAAAATANYFHEKVFKRRYRIILLSFSFVCVMSEMAMGWWWWSFSSVDGLFEGRRFWRDRVGWLGFWCVSLVTLWQENRCWHQQRKFVRRRDDALSIYKLNKILANATGYDIL